METSTATLGEALKELQTINEGMGKAEERYEAVAKQVGEILPKLK